MEYLARSISFFQKLGNRFFYRFHEGRTSAMAWKTRVRSCVFCRLLYEDTNDVFKP